VSKKTEKPIKPKKPNRKKKPIKILKKLVGSVRFGFGFISKKLRKSNRAELKPKKNQKKPSQTGKTEPNRFEPVFVLKNRTEPKPVGLN